jgi:hypothetical protein
VARRGPKTDVFFAVSVAFNGMGIVPRQVSASLGLGNGTSVGQKKYRQSPSERNWLSTLRILLI